MRRLALAVCLLGACSNPSGPERALDGKLIYDRHCARCHGIDGKPTKESPGARDLSNASYMSSLHDDDLRAAIEKGRPPNMPPFAGKFMDPSLKILIAHVRSLSDPELAKVNQAAPKNEAPSD